MDANVREALVQEIVVLEGILKKATANRDQAWQTVVTFRAKRNRVQKELAEKKQQLKG